MMPLSVETENPQAAEPDSATTGDTRAERILEHMPRVHWIASRIHARLPAMVSIEDLVSVGVLGLIAAVDNYDPGYNVKLQTYADHRIRGAILDSIRGLDGIPPHKRAKARELNRAVGTAEQRLSRTACAEDIAEELGITIEEYHSLALDTRQVEVRSLEAAPVNGPSNLQLLDMIADGPERQPYQLMEQAELRELVRRGIEALPPMERSVLTLYFHEGLCLREIAAAVNLHITRISQIKARAITRLRGFIKARWVAAKGGKFARTCTSIRPDTIVVD